LPSAIAPEPSPTYEIRLVFFCRSCFGTGRAHNNLGGALLTIGRVDDAIAHYRKALELRPDYADAATMLSIAEANRAR
jgi:tetratricopeptide (TPR) repeat protein